MLLIFAVLSVFFSLSLSYCYAEEPKTIINADSLEYDKNTSEYVAKGSVVVQQDKTTIKAAQMRYNDKTSLVIAEIDVVYDTPDIILKAEKAEFNIKTKTGTFYKAEIFAKRDKFYIKGSEIEKRGEFSYFLKDASLTSCDGASPDWCFKGRDVDLVIGDRVTARDATFNIKDFPVMYSPYIWAPALTERTTGLLSPLFGYSKTKGLSYHQPFFWAINEERDATFIFDAYSKRGFGEGIEYRYLKPGGISGNYWLYHLRDSELKKDFYEFRSSHEKRNPTGLSAYLDLNLVNHPDFYQEFSRERDERIQRFLQSTGEVSTQGESSRFYLLSQYYIDLKKDTNQSEVVQRLPEIGYTLHPRKTGPVIFSLTSSATNFTRDTGVTAQRFDLYPKLSHSFGDRVVIFQNLGLRETAYSFDKNEPEGYKSSVNRELMDYTINASSRFLKNYKSFSHAIEPTLGYNYVPWVKKDKTNLPVFDATENYSRQSTISLSVVHRMFDKEGEFLTMSISESFNSYGGDRPFSPLALSLSLNRPLSIKADTTYNTHYGYFETANSSTAVTFSKLSLSVGERYNRAEKTLFYDFGTSYAHSKTLSADANLWYDARDGGIKDITIKMKYTKQCWRMILTYNKKPGDYSISVNFELLGFGSMKG